MRPPAPGLFSMMAVAPVCSWNFCITRRANRSLPPPAAKPTTMRIGLLGKSLCAWAGAANAASSASAASTSGRILIIMFPPGAVVFIDRAKSYTGAKKWQMPELCYRSSRHPRPHEHNSRPHRPQTHRPVRPSAGFELPVRHRDVGALLLLRHARSARALHDEVPAAAGALRERARPWRLQGRPRGRIRPAGAAALRVADLRL